VRTHPNDIPYPAGFVDVIKNSTRFTDQDTIEYHLRWINGRNPGRIESFLFQLEHQFFRDPSWSKLPVESEQALVLLQFVSRSDFSRCKTTTNKALPLEPDSSWSIAPQSAIAFSFDRWRFISSCKTTAVAFCALTGTMLGICRMSADEELVIGQTDPLGSRIA